MGEETRVTICNRKTHETPLKCYSIKLLTSELPPLLYTPNQMTITLRPHQQRGLDALKQNAIGQVIVPTGGGKTLITIMDAVRRFEIKVPRTIVVVAPRILLAITFAVNTWSTSTTQMFFMFTVERPNTSEQLNLNRSNCSWRCVKPFVNMLSSSPHITPCTVCKSLESL